MIDTSLNQSVIVTDATYWNLKNAVIAASLWQKYTSDKPDFLRRSEQIQSK